jgi:hypothetical protein
MRDRYNNHPIEVTNTLYTTEIKTIIDSDDLTIGAHHANLGILHRNVRVGHLGLSFTTGSILHNKVHTVKPLSVLPKRLERTLQNYFTIKRIATNLYASTYTLTFYQ